ncbi:LrgB family protein [Tardiphaga sp.]|uniref:LrgB family protein n=1 Tax=Tardiphaga sp. TaxID=1926292 RepID=UPI0037D9B745
MSENYFSLWVYLSKQPLTWLTITLVVYGLAEFFSSATGKHPFANPVLHSMWIIAVFLHITGTSYSSYFSGSQFVHFLLGPATVALGVPLYENRQLIRAAVLPIFFALLVGGTVAIFSVVILSEVFGLPKLVELSLAPKSVTAAVAMGISESLGGNVSLTAATVIVTGILGAIAVTPLMNLLRINDYRARGFALGLASHGIGTARALQINPLAGAFAGLAMGLNALLTSMLIPVAAALLHP